MTTQTVYDELTRWRKSFTHIRHTITDLETLLDS